MGDLDIFREKDGFLKCQNCSRRFLTKIGFQNHSLNEENNDSETQLDQLPRTTNKKDETASEIHTVFDSVHKNLKKNT